MSHPRDSIFHPDVRLHPAVPPITPRAVFPRRSHI
uniref:Peptidase C31 domain-containing protein n=1 Tax=Anguilla anguilla TaxID=7936 RepID=A0A0E9TGY0_ANGAN